jgi:uncharacterized Zn-binding protein involved in type VI secretion
MPSVQRQGDANSAGGVIKAGVNSVRVNGRPIATVGLSVTPHPCCGKKGCPPVHCFAKTSIGAGTVRVNGRPVALTGNKDTCGHARSGGSPNVKAV